MEKNKELRIDTGILLWLIGCWPTLGIFQLKNYLNDNRDDGRRLGLSNSTLP